MTRKHVLFSTDELINLCPTMLCGCVMIEKAGDMWLANRELWKGIDETKHTIK